QKQVRLPWLKVQMPRFAHSEEKKAALLAYFVEHDRIPADSPQSGSAASPSTLNSQSSSSAQVLVTGQTLVGAKGFSCLACHEIGSYVPKNVALGTRGSNLVGLGERMRREYYLRW